MPLRQNSASIRREHQAATMGDRLTQLQDAVDQVRILVMRTILASVRTDVFQLAQQFVACLYFVHRRHELETLGPDDKVRDVKQEQQEKEGVQARPPIT